MAAGKLATAEVHQRIVALAVGDKRSEDTRYMWRFAYAHVLEQGDRIVIVHARIGAPAGWVPLSVGQAVGADEAGWLPEEMRAGLKTFKGHSEYWQLKGLSASEAVEEFVETRGVRPDLLIVGSRGDTGLKRAFMGSTSQHIVSTVDVPCLVVRLPVFVHEEPPFRLPSAAGVELSAPLPKPDRRRQIAIAVDGSPVSSVLVRWAAQTLLRDSDNVALLHSPASADEFATLSAAGQLVECELILQTHYESKEKAQAQTRTVRLAPDRETREALVEAVDKEGPFDVLICGSRGMGALKRTMEKLTGHGSVSSHCLQHAPCPVLVVSRNTLLAWIEAAAMPATASAVERGGKIAGEVREEAAGKQEAAPPKQEAAAAAAPPVTPMKPQSGGEREAARETVAAATRKQ